MLEQLKLNLDAAVKKLDELEEYIEDQAEDFSEEITELWGKAKQQMSNMSDQLKKASSALETKTDEAELAVHLATMDAHDQWEQLNKTLSGIAQQTKNQGKAQLNLASLQAHLAAMEGRDFMQAKGEEISHDYHSARAKLEQATLKAATDMKTAFDGFIAGLPK